MPSTVRRAADIPCILIVAIVAVCSSGCSKGELRGLREAKRIAEEARQEQAEQNTIFAELEATLSEERQAVDRERALAAERHDTAAKERSDVLIERRREIAAARRDSALAQALIALAPLGIVGVVVWAVIRAVRLMLRPRPEDTTVAEYLLGELEFFRQKREPSHSDPADRLYRKPTRDVPDELALAGQGTSRGTDSGDAGEPSSLGAQNLFHATNDTP